MIADPIDIKPDRRRARTRAALLQAGESLFAAQSVEAVSIDDIVAAADVAKGSFYNHFADREALARAIAGQVRTEAEAQVDQINDGVADPARRMARAQMVFARFALQNPQRARAMMRLFAGATLPNAPLAMILVVVVFVGILATIAAPKVSLLVGRSKVNQAAGVVHRGTKNSFPR